MKTANGRLHRQRVKGNEHLHYVQSENLAMYNGIQNHTVVKFAVLHQGSRQPERGRTMASMERPSRAASRLAQTAEKQ